MTKKELLEEIAGDEDLLEVARAAIENELISLRDSRIALVGRNNGLVVKEKDGTHSSLIRMGPEWAMIVGFKAIAKALKEDDKPLKHSIVTDAEIFGTESDVEHEEL